MAHRRQLFRVAIDRTGQVRRGDETIACDVIDLTEKGVRLRIGGTFGVGERLHLRFPLTEGDWMACDIQITHTRLPEMGATIVDIASAHRQRLSRFIEQVNALSMTGI